MMGMTCAAPLQESIQIVAAMLGDRYGVKVHVGGTKAMTDLQQIWIPEVGPECSRNALWAFLAHESAHVRFTDPAWPKKPGLHGYLRNAIEDARIEVALVEVFPGVYADLSNLVAEMVANGGFAPASAKDNEATVLSAYVLYRVRSDDYPAARGVFNTTRGVAIDKFGPGFVGSLDAILDGVPKLTCTKDAHMMVDEILKLMKDTIDDANDPTPPNGDDDNQNSQNDDDGSSDASGSGSASGSDDDGDEESTSESAGGAAGDGGESGQEDSGQAASGSGGTSDDDGQPSAEEGSTGDGNEDAKGSSGESSESDSGQTSAGNSAGGGTCEPKHAQALQSALDGESTLGDTFEEIGKQLSASAKKNPNRGNIPDVPTPIHLAGDVDAGNRRVEAALAESAYIRRRMRSILDAKTRTPKSRKDSGQRILGRHLATANHDPRVFQGKRRVIKPNAAVHVSIDMSGSMVRQDNGLCRAETAMEAGISVAQGLNGIQGVNTGVSAFAGWHNGQVFELLPHGRHVNACRTAFGVGTGDSTPTAEALMYAAYKLLRQPEPLRICICVTDGVPDDADSTREVIARMEASGIKVYGIGIGTERASVQGLFKHSVQIRELSELRNVIFGLVSPDALLAA